MQPQAARVKTALSPRVLEAWHEKKREREREKELARRQAAATGSGLGAGAVPFNPPHGVLTRTMSEEDEKQEREDVGKVKANGISAARATAKAGAAVTTTGQAAKEGSAAALRKRRMAEVQARLQAEEADRQSQYRKDKEQVTSSLAVKQCGRGRAVSFGNVEQATSSSSDEGSQAEDTGSGSGSDRSRNTVEFKPRPKRNAVEEVRRYMQERGPVQSSSRTMYDQILREARALEKMMNDDDVVIC